MKGSSRRPEQVGETLREVITDALARQVRDPRVGFVTVTAVLVTNDLSHARVMVSVPGEDSDKTRALEGLQSAAGFLRSRAARTLTPTTTHTYAAPGPHPIAVRVVDTAGGGKCGIIAYR